MLLVLSQTILVSIVHFSGLTSFLSYLGEICSLVSFWLFTSPTFFSDSLLRLPLSDCACTHHFVLLLLVYGKVIVCPSHLVLFSLLSVALSSFFCTLPPVILFPGIMFFFPPSLGDGVGFLSRVGTQHVTPCTSATRSAPVLFVQSVTTKHQTMRVSKLLIKILFSATIIAMASLNNVTKFDGLVLLFWKHILPAYP